MHFSSTSLWVRQTPGSDSAVSSAAVSSLGQARLRESRKWVSRPPIPAERRRPPLLPGAHVETDSWEYSMKLYFLEVKCILSNNYISNFALVNDIYLCCKQDNNYFIHFGEDNAPLP